MNMNKLIGMMLALLLCINCSTSKDRKVEKKITYILLQYVEWDLETPLSVNCDLFDTYFLDDFKHTIKITDSLSCDTLKQKFNTFRIIKEKMDIKPDVRIKIKITYDTGKTSKICIGYNRIITVDGSIVEYNSDVVEFVRNYININEHKN